MLKFPKTVNFISNISESCLNRRIMTMKSVSMKNFIKCIEDKMKWKFIIVFVRQTLFPFSEFLSLTWATWNTFEARDWV